VSGDAHAYQYLPESTQKHVTAHSLAEQMRQTGYHSVGFEKFQFGTMAVHWGKCDSLTGNLKRLSLTSSVSMPASCF
jgi:hypothetical protein